MMQFFLVSVCLSTRDPFYHGNITKDCRLIQYFLVSLLNAGLHVHVSNPDTKGLDRCNAHNNVGDWRKNCAARCYLFHILPSLYHVGE